MATFCTGAAAFFTGRFRQACELLDRATALFRDRCTGVVWELDYHPGLRPVGTHLSWRAARAVRAVPVAGPGGARAGRPIHGVNPGDLPRGPRPASRRRSCRCPGTHRGADCEWSQQGFHVQHLTHYYGNTYIDLYEADGPAAWRRAESTWPSIRASLLTRIEHVKGDVRQCRCRRWGGGRFRESGPTSGGRRDDRAETAAQPKPVRSTRPRCLHSRASPASGKNAPVGALARGGRRPGRHPAGRPLRRRGTPATRRGDRRRGGSRARRPGRRLDVGPGHPEPNSDGGLHGAGFPEA